MLGNARRDLPAYCMTLLGRNTLLKKGCRLSMEKGVSEAGLQRSQMAANEPSGPRVTDVPVIWSVIDARLGS